MDFYSALSEHYDGLFPAGEAEMRFVDSLLEGGTRLLDIGCGTGNKTARLAAPGRTVEAFDADPGMVARAEARHAAPGLAYRVLDMRAMEAAFAPASFDAAVCLGNTLVHLADPGAVEVFLAAVARLLAAGGVFVTQILNYDRILDRAVDALPALESEGATLLRRYARRGGVLHFLTELRLKDGGVYTGDAPLRPLRRAQLARGLADAGFGTVDWYGGYDGGPATPDAFHLIAAARRARSPRKDTP